MAATRTLTINHDFSIVSTVYQGSPVPPCHLLRNQPLRALEQDQSRSSSWRTPAAGPGRRTKRPTKPSCRQLKFRLQKVRKIQVCKISFSHLALDIGARCKPAPPVKCLRSHPPRTQWKLSALHQGVHSLCCESVRRLHRLQGRWSTRTMMPKLRLF